MKKTNVLVVMALLLIGTFGIVAAEEVEDVPVPEVKKVGFFEDRIDRIRLAFTFNKEKRIERALAMAEKRLAEAEILVEEDPEAYARVRERYNELVAKAEEALEDIESRAEDAESSVGQMERIARIQNQFERHRDHADEIYTRARERFEFNNVSEEKLERFENFHQRALNRSDEMEARILEKRENAALKYKALTEVTDEELEDLLSNIEQGEGLTHAREVRMEKFEGRLDRLEDRGIAQTERVRDRLEDAALTEEQKVRLNERLDRVEGQIEAAGDRIQERFEEQGEVVATRAENLKNAIEDELGNRLA